MIDLYKYINEGLLAGQETTIKGGTNIAKNVIYDEACKAIEEFIKDNYRLTYERSLKDGKVTIRKRPNKDGKWIVDCKTTNDVQLIASAKTITNDMFVWGKVRNFRICDNDNITSLKGCPEEVESFSVMRVHNLKSLEGMPKVTWYFNFGFNGIKAKEAELKKISGAPNVTIWDRN
jgi:hypothetical protein